MTVHALLKTYHFRVPIKISDFRLHHQIDTRRAVPPDEAIWRHTRLYFRPIRAVAWYRQCVTGFSLCRLGFITWPVHVGFVEDQYFVFIFYIILALKVSLHEALLSFFPSVLFDHWQSCNLVFPLYNTRFP